MDIKKVREACPDHLRAFDGLFGFSMQDDHYSGTIFRFPLRSLGCDSQLKDSSQILDIEKTRSLLDKYFTEARVSLLFLKNVKSVDFAINNSLNWRWSVCQRSIQVAQSESKILETLICSMMVAETMGNVTFEDEWRVARSGTQHGWQPPQSQNSRVSK